MRLRCSRDWRIPRPVGNLSTRDAMLALVEITWWHWIGFIACVLIFLALDLGVFHRRAHQVRFKEALAWTTVWFCLAMLFALGLKPLRGSKEALQFLTGYLIELSLSMDNVF